ncbi:hypothetical protein [uncultured Draconibacterium sp.]|uniref:hypothetical protein n=1 Tax=uncultured Draconibacterium sp. TaxID=1573823 RepID=UPI0025CCA43B|nr:hypothetical protein [uncultured Draconibacterium sp.]
MKKQILFLTFFVAALLAGTSVAFGQATNPNVDANGDYIDFPENPTCISAKTLSCLNATGELNPLPGETYTYTVRTTSDDDDVRWYVMNNYFLEQAGPPIDSIIEYNGNVMDLTEATYPATPIAAGGPYVDPGDGTGPYILRVGQVGGGGNTDYNVAPTSGDNSGVSFVTGSTTQEHSIDIAWKSFDGYQPQEVLLVAIVNDNAGCTNNIEVYRIVPEFLFTLDLAALSSSGDSIGSPTDGSTAATECVSPIESAEYTSADNTPGNGTLTVDYGENWVFFVVNAANFVDSWLPRFQISHDYGGTAGSVSYIDEVSWAYQNDDFAYTANAMTGSQTWHNVSFGSGVDWTSDDPVIAGGVDGTGALVNAVGDGIASGAGGECIIVRVKLDWGTQVENAEADVTLSFAVDGVMFDPNETAASPQTDQFDFANQTLADLGEDNDNLPAGDPDCDPDLFANDVMDYTVTPRPQVISSTGTTPEPFEMNTGDNPDGVSAPTNPNIGDNN